MINSEVSRIFLEMSILLDMKNVPFKPRAFEKAADSLRNHKEDLEDIYKHGGLKALEDIPGIGQGMAERIEEYIKTGHIKDHQQLKKQLPIDTTDLSAIEGIGPKTMLLLYKKLKIKNRNQLEKAAKSGKLKGIPGVGVKTEQNIIKAISFARQESGRLLLHDALPVARAIAEKLRAVPGVLRVEYAGSLRRMQETIGDIDLLAISRQPQKVMDAFVSLPEVADVHDHGKTKSAVRLKIGINSDLRVLPPESFGAALQYFTGDKYHNVELRQIAIRQGYKLNEYGLYKGTKMVVGATEEEIYEKLGFTWIPPELRTNNGELDAARGKSGGLPALVGYSDLKGDLQIQTDWTDGENSIEEMAKAAMKAGLEYICITDHTKALGMAGGCDEKKLLRQMTAIDDIQKKLPSIKILKGVEVDILKDGTLDIEDSVLAQLDVVGASVHSSFNLSEKDQTARIIRAMENPNVDIIFHPTGRVVLRREPYAVDMDTLLKTAKRTGIILEINASSRLDLKDEYIRNAIRMGGIRFAIDSDAHSTAQLQLLPYGIAQARRGWTTKNHVINTRSWKEMLKLLKQG